jgi:hypothetical protein
MENQIIENQQILESNLDHPRVLVDIPQIDFIPGLEKTFSYIASHYPDFFRFVQEAIGILVGISIPVSLLLIIGIIISVERLKRIRQKEAEILYPKVEPAYQEDTPGATMALADAGMGFRWRRVLEHADSPNPSDWRQAIIEADIILGDLLQKMGYQGESIGERLKRVERADFNTLDQAWAAHKVRNQIAHDGSSFEISQHEVKRVVALYRQVFEEFYYIQ